jgi:hypothetical protein
MPPKKDKSKPIIIPLPDISFNQGIAVSVTDYWLCNTIIGSSTYRITHQGTYTEFHIDPEHGGGPIHEVDESRLIDLANHNPHSIPLHEVLGKKRETVDKIMDLKGIAYHLINL